MEQVVDVERTVELLRVMTGGVVLSVVEHPELWTTERKYAVIDDVLELLGLKTPSREPVPALRDGLRV